MAVFGDLGRNARLLLGQIEKHRLCVTLLANSFNGSFQKSVSYTSQAAPRLEPDVDDNENVSKKFVNRNPRNLEQMALAIKDRGWGTVWPSRQYYHRLVFSRSQHYVTAQVFSPSSLEPVLSCSTQEWALKRELGSPRAVAACQAVGEVLAQRCQEAGLLRLSFRTIPWEFRSEAVQKFRIAMKEGGIILNEPRRRFV